MNTGSDWSLRDDNLLKSVNQKAVKYSEYHRSSPKALRFTLSFLEQLRMPTLVSWNGDLKGDPFSGTQLVSINNSYYEWGAKRSLGH